MVKLPRYVHFAKHHELAGQYAEAEANYVLLAEAMQQTLGDKHPDFATAIHELGRFYHHCSFEQTPEMRMIYSTIGRSSPILVYYNIAREVREAALGDTHPAYAQSLSALAAWHKDQPDMRANSAVALVEQAIAIQRLDADPLPIARSLACRGDLAQTGPEPTVAIEYYRKSLELLALSSPALQTLDEAERCCQNSGKDAGMPDLIRKARELQIDLADPYFEMSFRLLEERCPELLAMVLSLHREQYRSEFLELRTDVLTALADAVGDAGDEHAATSFRDEAAQVQALLDQKRDHGKS
jgi:hypothetical protein